MQIPGIVWTIALVALPALSVWLEQYFAGAIWAAPVAALLLIVVKVVQVVRDNQPSCGAAGQNESAASPGVVQPPGKASRILLG